MSWQDHFAREVIVALIRAGANERKSASVVAASLTRKMQETPGVTDTISRNAVIGLASRARPKIQFQSEAAPSVVRAAKPAVPRVPAQPRQARVPAAPRPTQSATALRMPPEFEVIIDTALKLAELFIPVEQRLTLLQLGDTTCKWPIGDPLAPDFYFCGQHPDDGKPYCEFHSRRAYHQIDKKKSAPQRHEVA